MSSERSLWLLCVEYSAGRGGCNKQGFVGDWEGSVPEVARAVTVRKVRDQDSQENPRLWLLIPRPTSMITLACRRNLGLGEQDPLYTPACLILPGLLVSLRLRKLPVGLEASRGKSQKVLEMAQKRIIPDANINTISVIIYLWPALYSLQASVHHTFLEAPGAPGKKALPL